ncbi:MAG: MoaD/ThiS family protein [Pirellulaceae bacterium]|nr:MoaD/ThiS family protein [Pirellulaceae bacterium]
MTTVQVNLYASFRQHVGGQPTVERSIEPGQTVGQLLGDLGIPLETVRIIFCNHRLVEPTHPLAGGETLGVFPAIGGG